MTEREALQELVAARAARRGLPFSATQEQWNTAFNRLESAWESARAALAAPEAQPAFWTYMVNDTYRRFDKEMPPDDAYDEGTLQPLYLTLPQSSPERARLEPVALEWEYVGPGPYPKRGYRIARTLEEMPHGSYPEFWKEVRPLYAAAPAASEPVRIIPRDPDEEALVAGMEASCLGRPSVDDERYVLSIWHAIYDHCVSSTDRAAQEKKA